MRVIMLLLVTACLQGCVFPSDFRRVQQAFSDGLADQQRVIADNTAEVFAALKERDEKTDAVLEQQAAGLISAEDAKAMIDASREATASDLAAAEVKRARASTSAGEQMLAELGRVAATVEARTEAVLATVKAVGEGAVTPTQGIIGGLGGLFFAFQEFNRRRDKKYVEQGRRALAQPPVPESPPPQVAAQPA